VELEILVVCTGNICRSPMGAALLRHHLDEHGLDARVASAGTMRWERPPTDEAITVMAERGLDIASHRSRPLTPEVLRDVNLVLGMTRTHVAVATTQGGDDVAARAFLVGEAARLAESVGARREGERAAEWVARLDTARDHQHGRAMDEVADPVGQSIDVYRLTADTLDRHLSTFVTSMAADRRLR
jgi:protein-tyrosine phosphatase